jgi:hypothetical protein
MKGSTDLPERGLSMEGFVITIALRARNQSLTNSRLWPPAVSQASSSAVHDAVAARRGNLKRVLRILGMARTMKAVSSMGRESLVAFNMLAWAAPQPA